MTDTWEMQAYIQVKESRDESRSVENFKIH